MTTFAIKVETEGFERAVPEIRDELQKILTKYTLLMQRDIVSNTPVDTGFLSAAIQPMVRELVGEVSPIGEVKKYAPFVEYDTRPHWPPIEAIEGWAYRHGLSAYVVARSIAQKGTKGHHMFEEGVKNVDTDAMMNEISAVIGKAWAG